MLIFKHHPPRDKRRHFSGELPHTAWLETSIASCCVPLEYTSENTTHPLCHRKHPSPVTAYLPLEHTSENTTHPLCDRKNPPPVTAYTTSENYTSILRFETSNTRHCIYVPLEHTSENTSNSMTGNIHHRSLQMYRLNTTSENTTHPLGLWLITSIVQLLHMYSPWYNRPGWLGVKRAKFLPCCRNNIVSVWLSPSSRVQRANEVLKSGLLALIKLSKSAW